ncbi:MAG: dehydrogenase [Rhodocyclaceae bacterium]|nr:dehydrogenase [Rhodocyclaceae bacterium]
MPFLMLIIEPRGQRAARSADEAQARYDEMSAFAGQLNERGVLRAAESLRADEHGVRVGQVDGRLQLRDGPFAEAKEMVGGFFLLDVASLDEALEIARQCPAARFATVEVRECAPCNA